MIPDPGEGGSKVSGFDFAHAGCQWKPELAVVGSRGSAPGAVPGTDPPAGLGAGHGSFGSLKA